MSCYTFWILYRLLTISEFGENILCLSCLAYKLNVQIKDLVSLAYFWILAKVTLKCALLSYNIYQIYENYNYRSHLQFFYDMSNS
jgi:hypothetical protein